MIRKIKSIFNNFKGRIVEVSSNRTKLESYLNCVDDQQRKSLFTRKRVWTFQNLVNAILMCFKKTLTEEVVEFLLGHNLPLTSPEAYIKRRGFISDLLFRDMNDWLIKDCLASGVLSTWMHGKYLCGLDGSRVSLPYTPVLYKKYRERDDKGHNLARAAFITDLVNRVIVKADLYPNKREERKSGLELLTSSEFPYPLLSTIFVMDRGYPSLFIMNWFKKNTGGFIIKARRDTSPRIAEFMDSDKTSATVTLKLSKNRRDLEYDRPDPIEVRLVKRPPIENEKSDEAQPTVLITNLDARDYPDDAILSAYRKRWNTETEIGTDKNELQMEIFSGVREVCIRQDFFSSVILYNMETIIRIPCNRQLAAHKGKYGFQVDMNCTWDAVIHLINILFGPPVVFARELAFYVKLFLKIVSVYRPGRSSPRIKRNIKLSGKYITYTNYKRGI